MVVAPATNVNEMGLVSEMPGTPMADIFAVPDQVPANAGGIVPPGPGAVVAGVVAGCPVVDCAVAGAELLLPLVEPVAGPPLPGDRLVSSRTPATMRATTTAPPPAATMSPHRERAGPAGRVDPSRRNADPAIAGTESAG